MIYKNFQGRQLSALGMGCMRLPHKEDYNEIDIPATKEMVAYAMAQGVNYYDTAWGYHGGNSERAMGEVLSAYPRESIYLASKFPGYDLNNFGKTQEIFEEQLKKCRVEYFDFYLIHNVNEENIESYLSAEYDTFPYLLEQKKKGRIRHLGFSTHGSLATMRRFLDAYGKDMEFCQIQLNWIDYHFQNAKAKVEMLNEMRIPIWVMEPLRGGSLCALAPKYEEKLRALYPERTPTEWAFRFLQTIPGVAVTLSGMSNYEQTSQNIATFQTERPLTDSEMELLLDFGKDMTSKKTLACTSCRYCTDHCPQGLDIPWMIELYNEHAYSGGGFIAPSAVNALAEEKRPTACARCRSCEAVCPQQIKISEMMAEFQEMLK
ncbi:MAG: aldo/keto reductase [Clostridia bacterium]|nr:aldo/keto reductase [Clostridia bacterium]